MAALSLILEERKRQSGQAQRESFSSKVRLVADPTTSVADLAKVFRQYLEHHKSEDLWALICPPPSGPHSYSWQTSPQPQWLAKTAGLLYDLLVLAPNSKLASKKVLSSLDLLYKSKVLWLPPNRQPQATMDRLDTTVRILLAMLRSLKMNEELRSKCWRLLGREEQVMLEIALDKLQLPPGYCAESQIKGGEEDSGQEIQAAPIPGDLVIFQPMKTSSSWSLKTPPSIFAKILAMDVEKPSSHDLSENALLADAGAFVPEVSKSEKKKKKLTEKKKSKTLKVVKKEKTESKTKDMAKKNARNKASPKKPSKEQGLLTLAEIPEDVSSFKFECPTYGSCKLEMYSEKSYIRQWNQSDKKWRLIIGSCDKTYHRQLCRRLVPEVQRGKNAADLKMIREKFLDDLKDVD
ncbi:unnamed protein product [Effrenium voratum]|uniref:Uncharacterized protein n=1 Tax=Effrenium voratum TaxID=2562239 RepID=A0AA36MLF7_9DINO|nr:unnamed protein product [Effrenium voratum]